MKTKLILPFILINTVLLILLLFFGFRIRNFCDPKKMDCCSTNCQKDSNKISTVGLPFKILDINNKLLDSIWYKIDDGQKIYSRGGIIADGPVYTDYITIGAQGINDEVTIKIIPDRCWIDSIYIKLSDNLIAGSSPGDLYVSGTCIAAGYQHIFYVNASANISTGTYIDANNMYAMKFIGQNSNNYANTRFDITDFRGINLLVKKKIKNSDTKVNVYLDDVNKMLKKVK